MQHTPAIADLRAVADAVSPVGPIGVTMDRIASAVSGAASGDAAELAELEAVADSLREMMADKRVALGIDAAVLQTAPPPSAIDALVRAGLAEAIDTAPGYRITRPTILAWLRVRKAEWLGPVAVWAQMQQPTPPTPVAP